MFTSTRFSRFSFKALFPWHSRQFVADRRLAPLQTPEVNVRTFRDAAASRITFGIVGAVALGENRARLPSFPQNYEKAKLTLSRAKTADTGKEDIAPLQNGMWSQNSLCECPSPKVSWLQPSHTPRAHGSGGCFHKSTWIGS